MSKKQRETPRDSDFLPMPARIAKALSVLASGLLNPWDESTDDKFRPFSAPFPVKSPINGQTLRAALKIAPRYHIDISEMRSLAFEAGEPDRSAFLLLQKVMKVSLNDIKVVYARAPGVVRVRMWILGRVKGGGLAGLRSESTET
ncbi:MAG TPA: hypothetical protein VMJ66_08270 [Geobacteraceae bacterium]|nr:hypothetical protein [Geobacteraceae bacterium]